MLRPLFLSIVLGLTTSFTPWAAATTVIDFEGVDNLQSVGSFYAGVEFFNATVLTAQISLNEVEFPPHSGTKVALDNSANMVIQFDAPQGLVSGFLTYATGVTVTAFEVGSGTLVWHSAFNANTGNTGDPGSAPNEAFSLASARGISSVVIAGALAGNSFVLDDLSYAAVVAEPATAFTLGLGLLALLLPRRRRARAGVAAAGLAAVLPMAALAQAEISQIAVTPQSVPYKTATAITVTATVVDPKVTDGSVVLQSVDPAEAKKIKVLGTLKLDQTLTNGSRVYKLATTMTLDAPTLLRLSYGVDRVPLRKNCSSMPLNPSDRITDVTPAGIATFIKNNSVTTAGQLLASLPAEYKQNWLFMTRSESAQESSSKFPRVLIPSSTSHDIFGFELDDGSGTRTPQKIEYLAFNDTAQKFTFYEIDVAKGTVADGDDPNRPGTHCSDCHSGRPNWDAYDNWAGLLPFNRDRLYQGSVEVKAITKLLETLRAGDVVSRLELPKYFTANCDGSVAIDFDPKSTTPPTVIGLTPNTIPYDIGKGGRVVYPGKLPAAINQGGTYRLLEHSAPKRPDEGRGVSLFDDLSAFNSQRLANMLATLDAKAVPDVRPVVLAIAGQKCDYDDPTKWTTKTALAALYAFFNAPKIKSVADLVVATDAQRATLPQLKANLQSLNLGGAAGLIATWSTDVPSATGIAQETFRRTLEGNPIFHYDRVPGLGRAIDRELYANLGPDAQLIALFRLFLEPSKIDVGLWSMSVMSRSRTYTFGDLFAAVYGQEIARQVGAALDTNGKALNTLACADLQAASVASFKSAYPGP